MTANGTTGLYSQDSLRNGYVSIDGTLYDDGSPNASELLGHKVEAYIKSEKSEDDVVIYAVDLSAEKLTIDADLVQNVSDDCRTIEYYSNEDSKRTDKAVIAADAAYLLNDVSYTTCQKADFFRDGTTIVLVDNDKDGNYDLVNLLYAETMIVSTVSTATQTIYNEYQFDGALTKLELEEYEKTRVSIYKNGAIVDLAELTTGDVLSVYRAGTGKNGKIKINVEKDVFSGRVEEYNEAEKTVVIDNKEYEYSELYLRALKNNESAAQRLQLNSAYTIRLDGNGKIVSAVLQSGTDLLYGYITKIAKDTQGIGSSAKMEVFLSDGSWQVYEFDNKVQWNGENVRIKGMKL